jgi:large subunit ribosomal protein L19
LLQVKLNPRPWHERWERYDLQGVEDLGLAERFYKRAEEVAKPWEKYDIIKKHRESIDDDETQSIMEEVFSKTEATRKARSRQKGKLKKSA